MATNAPKPKEPTEVREALPGEYPKMLYFKGDVSKQKIIDSVVAEDALGADWVDAPSDPDAPVA